MRIFHLATRADWEAARASGSYTTSTLGRTLAEEGFIHASRGDQWQGVRERFYAGVTEPLVLLVIETTRLVSPVVDEVPDDRTTETFPHVYGPINASAVVRVIPLPADAAVEPTQSFSRVFWTELLGNALLLVLVMVCVGLGSSLGRSIDPGWGAWTGTLLGLAVSVPTAVVLYRRRA